MPDKKTVGELRTEERYHGNPNTDNRAFYRQSIDKSFTPESKYMKESVEDTADVMRRKAQEQTNIKAKQAYPKSFKKGGMVKKSGYAMVHKGERVLKKGFKN